MSAGYNVWNLMFRNGFGVPASRPQMGAARPLAVALSMSVAACGGGSTTPTPPATTNAPPVVQSVTAASARVEAGEEVQLTAVVTDAETPVANLTYVWSASPSAGTIVGTGASVRWRAPKPATTPDTYTLTLTVTETYGSGSSQRTNQATGSTQVRYHDSPAEIQGLVTKFLTDFSTDTVTADAAVVNFSDSTTPRTFYPTGVSGTCAAQKAEERLDVQDVRNKLHSIPPPTLGSPTITFNVDRTFADPVLVGCTFRNTNLNSSIENPPTSGTCVLSAAYESSRWWLCRSNFQPGGSSAIRPSWFVPRP